MSLVITGGGFLYAVFRLDASHRRRAEKGLMSGMVVALAILAVGFFYAKVTGVSLWETYFFDPLTTLNNGAIAISLLAWPAMAVAWRRDRNGPSL